MGFDLPDPDDFGTPSEAKTPETKQPTAIDFGDTTHRSPKTRPTELLAQQQSQTVIGAPQGRAGRPPKRRASFGPKAHVQWVTFQAQAETVAALQEAAGVTKRTELLELALASLVNEFNRKGHLNAVKIELAQGPHNIKAPKAEKDTD